MSKPLKDTCSLLVLPRTGEITYYSYTQRQWIKGATEIPLADICALSPAERDRLLEYFRADRRRGSRPAQRPLDAAQKTA